MLYLRWVLGVGVGSLMLFAAVRSLSWEEVFSSLEGFQWAILLPVLCLVLLSFLVRAYRWRLLFPVPARPGVGSLFLVETTGTAINSLSPVHVMAEPVQLFLLVTRFHLEGGTVVATLVVSRLIDLLVTVAIATGGILLIPALARLRPIVTGGWALVGIVLLVLILVHLGMDRLSWLRRRTFLQHYLRAWSNLGRRKDLGGGILAVTLLQWLLVALGLWLIAQALSIGVSFPEMLTLFIVALTSAGSLPSLPGAIGSFQLVWIFLLGVVGVGGEVAFTFAILAHAFLFLVPLVIAAITLAGLGLTWGEVRSLSVRAEIARDTHSPV